VGLLDVEHRRGQHERDQAYGRLFSHAVGGHESENEEIREAIREVGEVVGKRGIWIAAYFAAVYLGLRMKLRVLAGHVLRASKRVFGIPDFRLYALADGIRQYLYSQTQGLKKFFELQDQLPIQPKLFNP
jgi:hypothetical protein